MEVIESDKHSSLSQYGISNDREKLVPTLKADSHMGLQTQVAYSLLQKRMRF
jgi:hypothetical protein